MQSSRFSLASAVFLGVVLSSCGGSAAEDVATPDPITTNPSVPTPEPTVGKFEQTWTTEYAHTTCAHWHQDMDAHQQFVMAGDMLLAARTNDGESDLPADALIDSFVDNLGVACEGAGEELEVQVTEVAVLLYNSTNDFAP